MKAFIALTIASWFALFAWVRAFDIALIAALLSFIGFCTAFLLARRYRQSLDWGLGAAGAVVSPLLGALIAQAWVSIFPPAPCVGDDCVSVTIYAQART